MSKGLEDAKQALDNATKSAVDKTKEVLGEQRVAILAEFAEDVQKQTISLTEQVKKESSAFVRSYIPEDKPSYVGLEEISRPMVPEKSFKKYDKTLQGVIDQYMYYTTPKSHGIVRVFERTPEEIIWHYTVSDKEQFALCQKMTTPLSIEQYVKLQRSLKLSGAGSRNVHKIRRGDAMFFADDPGVVRSIYLMDSPQDIPGSWKSCYLLFPDQEQIVFIDDKGVQQTYPFDIYAADVWRFISALDFSEIPSQGRYASLKEEQILLLNCCVVNAQQRLLEAKSSPEDTKTTVTHKHLDLTDDQDSIDQQKTNVSVMSSNINLEQVTPVHEIPSVSEEEAKILLQDLEDYDKKNSFKSRKKEYKTFYKDTLPQLENLILMLKEEYQPSLSAPTRDVLGEREEYILQLQEQYSDLKKTLFTMTNTVNSLFTKFNQTKTLIPREWMKEKNKMSKIERALNQDSIIVMELKRKLTQLGIVLHQLTIEHQRYQEKIDQDLIQQEREKKIAFMREKKEQIDQLILNFNTLLGVKEKRALIQELQKHFNEFSALPSEDQVDFNEIRHKLAQSLESIQRAQKTLEDDMEAQLANQRVYEQAEKQKRKREIQQEIEQQGKTKALESALEKELTRLKTIGYDMEKTNTQSSVGQIIEHMKEKLNQVSWFARPSHHLDLITFLESQASVNLDQIVHTIFQEEIKRLRQHSLSYYSALSLFAPTEGKASALVLAYKTFSDAQKTSSNNFFEALKNELANPESSLTKALSSSYVHTWDRLLYPTHASSLQMINDQVAILVAYKETMESHLPSGLDVDTDENEMLDTLSPLKQIIPKDRKRKTSSRPLPPR